MSINTAEVRDAIRRDVKSGVLATKDGHDALVQAVDNLCAEIDRLFLADRALIANTAVSIIPHLAHYEMCSTILRSEDALAAEAVTRARAIIKAVDRV